jgi:deoxyribose-phosphate aldolase
VENLNKYFDHTCLRPEATLDDIKKLLKEAEEHKFASACLAPCWLDERIDGHQTKISTVVGFPHGNVQTGTKINQMQTGADEYDVVANIGDIKSGKWHDVEFEISKLRSSTPMPIKYIVEVGHLTDMELFRTAELLIKHKIDFIKTCTGYGPRGVTVDDIKKIKAFVGDRIKIKASGGIKTKEFAIELINAGADRIGSSSSVSIINS